ncbi:MAG TPA: tyrosine--tRNA ligase [Solirubrobacteraceae bacterium]|jgi:tyrosyl-tRNA synthetase|nr:tyrosine--tRNA ligase [Solirubrobacteraceae bacterium]
MRNRPDAAASEQAAQLAGKLARNAVDSLPEGELAQKLAWAAAEPRPLRVKFGIDPTAADIHLGHAVALRKLREFQDTGHRVVLIVGDYTARVGDPSGRSTERPILSVEEIDANTATYESQALRILDGDPTRLEVRHNSEWLDMPMDQVLALARTATAAQLLERDDFAKRLAEGRPISVLELLYPLLQGYDSVAVRSDVELGGTDQKFNLLLARDVQRAYGEPAQAILTMPLLRGIDGQRKMSKSLGNEIGITEPPQEMFGKVMSIPDDLIDEYDRLLLAPARVGGGEGAGRDAADRAPVPSGAAARDAKRALARGIVSWLYCEADAEDAERHFERVHVEHRAPQEIADAAFSSDNGRVHVPAVMAQEFGMSRSEARRLIDQGGVMLGDATLAAGEHDVTVERADGQLLKVGKRRFRRLRAS